MRAALVFSVLALSSGLGAAPASAEPPVDFVREVLPIFQRSCASCHGPTKASGGLRVTTGDQLREGGISGAAVVPGNGPGSYLVRRLLGEGNEDRMPLGKDALPAEEVALIKRWIAEGATAPVEGQSPFVPAPGGLKRLTVRQYHNTLVDLFGEGIALPTELEPDTLMSGSAVVGAARIGLSRHGTEKFARAAFALGRTALRDAGFRARFLPCAPEATAPIDEPCAREFLERFGRRAWRRPLAADERERYLGLTRTAAPKGSLDKGLQAALAGLLQSPHFIYRTEIGRPDPTDPSRRILTDFEMASRLSYFLWSAPPDEALLEAAQQGRHSTDEGLGAEADRLLRSPRAQATMETFFAELFRLARLERLTQFRAKYKQMTDTLGPSMRVETLRLLQEVAFAPDRDFREIFDARFTYVNGELARLYGLTLPEGANEDEFVRVALPPGGRVGILGQGSFLATNAHATASSPTKRGKFIREVLLCQAVPPPPPDVSSKLPEDPAGAPARTTRGKLTAHRASPRCAGCHKAMDPLGLAFDTFDGIGAPRTKENGLPIDPSGELDGVPFKNAAELAGLLRASPKVGICVARSLFRFALGHLESEGEEPLMEDLARGLERDGYRFTSLLGSVVRSRGFRYLAAPK